MLKNDSPPRLYCSHHVPSDIECSDCRVNEPDYRNRPLYTPIYVPLPNLSTALDNSQLKLPSHFYAPPNGQVFNQARSNGNANDLLVNDHVEIQTRDGTVRVPWSTLVQRSRLDESTTTNKPLPVKTTASNVQQVFPGDFQKHAHRFTRSFSWKTKPEEPIFAQMQPLPKLIKRPGYAEICFKNICWPTHQLCLCCGRNTAESCRKWSKATGEYDYIDACWSSCALCSDDAYKILNTPVVYTEKIIDPEVLLPLDAELLYYSMQSAKRQQGTSATEADFGANSQKLPTTDSSKSVKAKKPSILRRKLSSWKKSPEKPKQTRSRSKTKSSQPKRRPTSRSKQKLSRSRRRPKTRARQPKSRSRTRSSRPRSRPRTRSSRPRSRSRTRSSRPRSRPRTRSSRPRSRSRTRFSRPRSRSRTRSRSRRSRSRGRSRQRPKSRRR